VSGVACLEQNKNTLSAGCQGFLLFGRIGFGARPGGASKKARKQD
jgi:hypothetical protein